jgi:hypothetical protein
VTSIFFVKRRIIKHKGLFTWHRMFSGNDLLVENFLVLKNSGVAWSAKRLGHFARKICFCGWYYYTILVLTNFLSARKGFYRIKDLCPRCCGSHCLESLRTLSRWLFWQALGPWVLKLVDGIWRHLRTGSRLASWNNSWDTCKTRCHKKKRDLCVVCTKLRYRVWLIQTDYRQYKEHLLELMKTSIVN